MHGDAGWSLSHDPASSSGASCGMLLTQWHAGMVSPEQWNRKSNYVLQGQRECIWGQTKENSLVSLSLTSVTIKGLRENMESAEQIHWQNSRQCAG